MSYTQPRNDLFVRLLLLFSGFLTGFGCLMLFISFAFILVPPIVLVIGIFSLIIGGPTLLYSSYKLGIFRDISGKSRTYTEGYQKSTSQQTISQDTRGITDAELRKNYNIAILMFLGGWAVAAISAPNVLQSAMYGGMTITVATFAIGTAAGLIGGFFIFMYHTNPEWYQEFLAKRKRGKKRYIPPRGPPAQRRYDSSSQTSSHDIFDKIGMSEVKETNPRAATLISEAYNQRYGKPSPPKDIKANFCPFCGNKVELEHSFCSNCRAKL